MNNLENTVKDEGNALQENSPPDNINLTFTSQGLLKNELKNQATDKLRHEEKKAPSSTNKGWKIKSRKVYDVPITSLIKNDGQIAKPQCSTDAKIYIGNILDSSLPKRKVGKHREVSPKKTCSKLKKDILDQECRRLSTDQVMKYCDNVVNSDLDEAAAVFIKKIVCFQENAFRKKSDKALIKRRYITGLHETRKYLLAKRVKILIIASDIRIYKEDELLYKNVEELKVLAKENAIRYIFALKRSKIGNLLKKHRPVSCIGVLNYQSAEDELAKVLDKLVKLEDTTSEANESEGVYKEFLNNLKEAITTCDDNILLQ